MIEKNEIVANSRKIVDCFEKEFSIDLKDKNKLISNLSLNNDFSFQYQDFTFRFLLNKDKYFIVGIFNHSLCDKDLPKLMNFCENICKEVNPLHLQDNSLFLKTDNILGKIMLSYMNKLITKTEKEQKLHYLKCFRKIEAYKKSLINTNPFLVFIEESARKKIKKKNVINSNTKYPLLHIKPFETTDVYPDIGFQITELTFNESKEYKIIIGNPPKTFFHYEYYSEEGDLLKALNHIKKKFADRGYELIMEKERILSEFR